MFLYSDFAPVPTFSKQNSKSCLEITKIKRPLAQRFAGEATLCSFPKNNYWFKKKKNSVYILLLNDLFKIPQKTTSLEKKLCLYFVYLKNF